MRPQGPPQGDQRDGHSKCALCAAPRQLSSAEGNGLDQSRPRELAQMQAGRPWGDADVISELSGTDQHRHDQRSITIRVDVAEA